ncbi:MAG: pyrroline-5-carboxylate reductase [Candidatus Hydrogenedens sp.]|nr:pyrroline-5-carboxylate reductase [Candidatus Hydrogenedens sp.]
MRIDTGLTLGFLGFGNMGSAILEGLVELRVWPHDDALVYDPSDAAQAAAARLGVNTAESARALAAASDILMLAVKPQMMGAVLEDIAGSLKPGALAISIAAGISIGFIQERLGTDRVVRVMPNTPCLAHAGAAGFALGPGCTEEDAALVSRLFNTIGIAERVPESDMDAVTAVSGSGPAYFFLLTECLIKAGMAEGLSEEVASRLAAHTLYGAGRLLHSSEDDPATLRKRVTSPGGTTEAALKQFAEDGFEALVARAVHAAVARSRELGA